MREFGQRSVQWLGLAGLCALTACSGAIGDDPTNQPTVPDTRTDTGTPGTLCSPKAPAPSPLRRLTRTEVGRTLSGVFGFDSAGDALPDDEGTDDPEKLLVSPLWGETFMGVAERSAARAVQDLSTLLPCQPESGEDACARQFIKVFGRRAFRRTVTAEETARLFALYQIGHQDSTFAHGIELVIQGALESPQFIYHLVVGRPNAPSKVTDQELAARLSYFFWSAPPDPTLATAADGGALANRAEFERQARRMLNDPRSAQKLVDLHVRWLGVGDIESVDKPDKYPVSTALADSMEADTRAFIDEVLWKTDGRLSTLLTAPVAFVDRTLAPVYGVTAPMGTAPQRMALDGTRRAGILTSAGLLAAHTTSDTTAAIHRGKMVRERLLCIQLPDPDPDVILNLPPVTPGVSSRQALTTLTSQPACLGCHGLMNPIGFGFENYDPVGAYRTTDAEQPVDASGQLTFLGEDADADAALAGPFTGVPELAGKLAQSVQVERCMIKTMASYALGPLAGDNACTKNELYSSYVAGGRDTRQLLVALTLTEVFTSRREVAP
jgi:hypothetical protein